MEPVPAPCLCGSQECVPPDPPYCSMKSCGDDKMEEKNFSKRYQCWTASCVTSHAHVSIFWNGVWCGDGCHRGKKKARST